MTLNNLNVYNYDIASPVLINVTTERKYIELNLNIQIYP